jgi:Sugar (pentulose and hexulose) kinases
MTGKNILAIDLGTSSLKLALVDIHGEVLGWESEPIALIVTADGGTEQSPEEWWQAFLKTAKRLLSKTRGSQIGHCHLQFHAGRRDRCG